MVFPLHSVSGPGSSQLLHDGIEPISNRLKSQQAVTTQPTGKAGGGGRGVTMRTGACLQWRPLGIEVQIFVYVKLLVSTLTLESAPVNKITEVG